MAASCSAETRRSGCAQRALPDIPSGCQVAAAPQPVLPPEAVDRGLTAFNFSAAAGPLPAPVIQEVAAACHDWRGQGSALSLPFTSDAFAALLAETRGLLRELLAIPESHDILFLQGGASAHFGLVPLILLGDKREAAYLESGHWSRRASTEGSRHCEVRIVRDARALADPAPLAYLHVTSNETADGVQLRDLPQTPVPLVADMTSDFLTRSVDWSRVGLAYAAMQKSIGVAGLTFLVLRRDLLGRARPSIPPVFDYTAQAAAGSRLNTPPVFAILVAHAMLSWIAARGGVGAVEAAVERRSRRVYAMLDAHPATFRVSAPPASRSRTSLCFGVNGSNGVEACIAAAQDQGILGLRGHPQAGGLRAAMYPGTSEAAVDRLCGFLADFAARARFDAQARAPHSHRPAHAVGTGGPGHRCSPWLCRRPAPSRRERHGHGHPVPLPAGPGGGFRSPRRPHRPGRPARPRLGGDRQRERRQPRTGPRAPWAAPLQRPVRRDPWDQRGQAAGHALGGCRRRIPGRAAPTSWPGRLRRPQPRPGLPATGPLRHRGRRGGRGTRPAGRRRPAHASGRQGARPLAGHLRSGGAGRGLRRPRRGRADAGHRRPPRPPPHRNPAPRSRGDWPGGLPHQRWRRRHARRRAAAPPGRREPRAGPWRLAPLESPSVAARSGRPPRPPVGCAMRTAFNRRGWCARRTLRALANTSA